MADFVVAVGVSWHPAVVLVFAVACVHAASVVVTDVDVPAMARVSSGACRNPYCQ